MGKRMWYVSASVVRNRYQIVLSVLVMEMVPYDFAEFVKQMFLWPVDENDLSALLLVIGRLFA